MSAFIKTTLEAGILNITLNNPQKHNAIGMEMLNALSKAVQEAEQNSEVAMLVFRGAGEKSFSAGGNLKEFGTLNSAQLHDWIRLGSQVFQNVESLAKPSVALIQGFCFGGGLELALCCDLRYCSEEASFSFPELSHGWLPGWGGIARVRKLFGEAKAKEIILLSEKISAHEAFRLGLVSKVFTGSQLEEGVKPMLQKLAALHKPTVSVAKVLLNNDVSGQGQWLDIYATLISKGLVKDE